ncbi:MAG: G5 domain-containing protein [Defluviitaleaceae bacterium]|nr:G5 domain-containing protein [Defluviitaleaceae bacterium]
MSGNKEEKNAGARNRNSRSDDKRSNERHLNNDRGKEHSGVDRKISSRGSTDREIKNTRSSRIKPNKSQRVSSRSSERGKRKRKPSIIRNIKAWVKRFFSYVRLLFSNFFSLFSGMKIPVSVIALSSALILIGITVFFFTNRNALRIEVDGVFVGVIERNRSITAEDLHYTAVAKTVAEVGTRIEVVERVTIVPVNARRRNMVTVDSAIDSIRRLFTYTLEAAVITVDGEEIAIVRNAVDAQSILDNIISEFVGDNATLVESGFAEDVLITQRFVDSDDIVRSELALSRLTTTTMTDSFYQVQPGDSVWLLSRNHGITQEEFFAMNPGVTPDLQIGQFITLTLPTPILSVRTVEEFKFIELAPHGTETITNSAQNRNWSRVAQQGRDGQQEVTVHIVRINGFERERITVDTVITVPPVDEIIEVGTR